MVLGTAFIDNSLMPVFFANAVGRRPASCTTTPRRRIQSTTGWWQNIKARYNTVPDLFDADGMNAAIAASRPEGDEGRHLPRR